MLFIIYFPSYSFQECVKRKALMSILVVRNISHDDAVKIVDRVFEKCYNDLEPFGRHLHNRRKDEEFVLKEASLYGYTDSWELENFKFFLLLLNKTYLSKNFWCTMMFNVTCITVYSSFFWTVSTHKLLTTSRKHIFIDRHICHRHVDRHICHRHIDIHICHRQLYIY